jgi:hypothetical protein
VPLLPAAGTVFTDLAVDALPFPTYSATWSILGDADAHATPRARLAVRHLTAATRCALAALPAGKANDAKAAQLVQDLKAAVDVMLSTETREHKSKRKAEAEVRRAALLCDAVHVPAACRSLGVGRLHAEMCAPSGKTCQTRKPTLH